MLDTPASIIPTRATCAIALRNLVVRCGSIWHSPTCSSEMHGLGAIRYVGDALTPRTSSELAACP